MSLNTEDYLQYTKTPWGRMFYEIVWKQIDLHNDKSLNILDFGSGFGITANHFAKSHNVLAIEPNKEMIENRIKENNYKQVKNSTDYLLSLPSKSFDVIICHNVLEYHENISLLFSQFSRLLAEDGIISIIVHNMNGKILQSAVFENNPQKSLALLYGTETADSQLFGEINICSYEKFANLLSLNNLKIVSKLGLRTFFALIQNNEIKYDAVWYDNNIKLELAVSDREPFKSISFYNHYIIKK